MPHAEPEGWQRNVWALSLIVFTAFVGFQFFSPFLPLYVQELGVTDPARVAIWSGCAPRRDAQRGRRPRPRLGHPRGPRGAAADDDPVARRLRGDHRRHWAGSLPA